MKLTTEEVATIRHLACAGLGVDDILVALRKKYRRQYYRPRIKMIVWPLSYVADARHRQRMSERFNNRETDYDQTEPRADTGQIQAFADN